MKVIRSILVAGTVLPFLAHAQTGRVIKFGDWQVPARVDQMSDDTVAIGYISVNGPSATSGWELNVGCHAASVQLVTSEATGFSRAQYDAQLARVKGDRSVPIPPDSALVQVRFDDAAAWGPSFWQIIFTSAASLSAPAYQRFVQAPRDLRALGVRIAHGPSDVRMVEVFVDAEGDEHPLLRSKLSLQPLALRAIRQPLEDIRRLPSSLIELRCLEKPLQAAPITAISAPAAVLLHELADRLQPPAEATYLQSSVDSPQRPLPGLSDNVVGLGIIAHLSTEVARELVMVGVKRLPPCRFERIPVMVILERGRRDRGRGVHSVAA